MPDEKYYLENKDEIYDEILAHLEEDNLPAINQGYISLEIIMNDLSRQVNQKKIQKANLDIEILQLMAEQNKWKSLKSTMKSIGANARQYQG
jgi:hypothetical protein